MTVAVSAPVEAETPKLSRKDLRELRRPWIYDLKMVTKIASDSLVLRLGEEGLTVVTVVHPGRRKRPQPVGDYAIWPLNKTATLVIIPEIYQLAWRVGDTETYVLTSFKEAVRHYITKHTVLDIALENSELTRIRAELDCLATPDNC